jgi:hypothetical protein
METTVSTFGVMVPHFVVCAMSRYQITIIMTLLGFFAFADTALGKTLTQLRTFPYQPPFPLLSQRPAPIRFTAILLGLTH